MSYTDAQIGRVLDTLRRTGLDRNTVIVLWADHGYHLGEHGPWCKITNYESDTHVPLVFVDPAGRGRSARCHALVADWRRRRRGRPKPWRSCAGFGATAPSPEPSSEASAKMMATTIGTALFPNADE